MTGSPDPSRVQDQRDAEILSRHLDSNFTGGFEHEASNVTSAGEALATAADGGDQESSLKLQGGDIHRDLYRIEARSKRARLEQRAQTFSYIRRQANEDEADEVSIANEPGGFRRQFVQQRANSRFLSVTAPVATNFVDFLDLYGSFAGENLAESEDESALEIEDDQEPVGEQRPLLGRRRTTKRFGERGDASIVKSFFTLLKAFVGTGIMFLPKAFRNGGLLFSSITLITVSTVTALCFHLLLECRRKVGGGYGEIGERIGGRRLRQLILFSITISQLGFVCAGIIFTAENMYAFLKAISRTRNFVVSTKALIAMQLIILIPLAFIRNISKLGPAALLADVFILIGLTYIYYYDIATLASLHGLNPSVRLFNPRDFTLTVGSAIFTFEGIGLILPIQSSMKDPQRFDALLYLVMFIITVIFTAVGALSYSTFGEKTRTEIITNFPQDSKLVNAVQFLYSLAVLVGTPVQLFPAVRIMENKLFRHRSGKRDASTKWKKNIFRTTAMLLCGLIAAVGAGDLDKFVALIGSFACVPLVYIYPAYLHFKGVAESKAARAGDLFMMAVGIACMVYTTGITVSIWIGGG